MVVRKALKFSTSLLERAEEAGILIDLLILRFSIVFFLSFYEVLHFFLKVTVVEEEVLCFESLLRRLETNFLGEPIF